MLIGPRHEAVAIQGLVNNRAFRIEPRLLNDGTYAVPESVLTNPNYSAAHNILSTWTVTTPASGDYATDGGDGFVWRNGNTFRHDGRRGSMTMPDPNVYRFEVRVNDFAGNYDSDHQNRRSEMVSVGTDRGIGNGTVWSSFCCILGNHEGLKKVRSGALGLIHQWHSVDWGDARSPVLGINYRGGEMVVSTRSDADPANSVVHYTGTIPAKGVKTYYVLEATFGQVGHLNVWMNETQIVNVDTPIGYYNDLTDGSGRTVLGYPHYGLYTRNQAEVDIVYIANPEWGTDSLADRIASPLSVPDLTW